MRNTKQVLAVLLAWSLSVTLVAVIAADDVHSGNHEFIRASISGAVNK